MGRMLRKPPVELSLLRFRRDPVRHFARRCCPKALRPIRSVLPQIVAELGRIKTYSFRDYSALRWLELNRQMRRYSGARPTGRVFNGLKPVVRIGPVRTRERMGSNPRNSLEIRRVLRCVTHVLWWPFLEHQGGLAFEVVVPFFKDF
jgi:hypothetical protein